MVHMHSIQVKAKMSSYLYIRVVNDDTLHELDMHNAGEMF